jgi:UDP-N-acetylmuramate: L-alanyl-gamma-D-glutamyl-meso-diaminopimelate ligase
MTKPNQPWFVRRPMPAQIETIHLIGIAGAGMGAFACMLKDAGYTVRGSDQNVYPPMSDVLRARDISWMEGWDAAHLAWNPDLVIVGNVCRRDNPEAVEAEARGIAISFPQAFSDLFLQDRLPVVVAGTHGKTTTTALTTWLLDEVGLRPGMLVGGVTHNFDASYRLVGGAGDPFVVEGDEYDTAYFDKGPKFLHYRPQVVILNNIEFDHADIYDSLDEIIENFDRLMDLLGPGTLLLANADDPLVVARAARSHAVVRTYGFSEAADLRAVHIEPGADGAHFEVLLGGQSLGPVHSPMAGRHNVWNALAAFGVGLHLGAEPEALFAAIEGFTGVKKRQEERGEADGVLVIDDYAHHPTAIRETVTALHLRYPNRRLWAVYEPKSNTARRNIHQHDYASAFDAADQVLLARPFVKKNDFGADERLDLDRLVAAIAGGGTAATYAPSVDDALAHLVVHVRPGDLVVFMSSSGFGGIHDRLLAALAER